MKNYLILGIVATGLALGIVYIKVTEKKSAFVNVGELYNEFDMKKELENTYLTVQKGRKNQLDSMELELRLLSSQLNTRVTKEVNEVFEMKRENYLVRQQQFTEDDQQMQEQYTEKIRKQLNQYVSDFGKESDYDLILGAEGSGAVMFAREENNITKEVLAYINSKYKGVK
jgi:outer membrane protein